MPGEELISTGDAYAFNLLENWKKIQDMDEEVRLLLLLKKRDDKKIREFIAKLTRMWLELATEMEDRSEATAAETSANFKEFRRFYLDPELLLLPENREKVFILEELIRKALQITKITKFEDTSL